MTSVSTGIVAYKMFINGEWVDASSHRTFDSLNPYTGRAWAAIPDGQEEDVDRAVKAARAAMDSPHWSGMGPTARGRLLKAFGDLLRDKAEHLARIDSTDNGKLIREMLGQAKALPDYYYYYAGLADKILGETIPMDKTSIFNYTLREPLGVVGIITPWNSPLLILGFSLAAALAAGNTVVVKPSEHASASTLEFAKVVQEAGFPPGVFNVVTGFGKTAGTALVSHPAVRKVVFTGGTEVGRVVGQQAAGNITPVLLELGGKSPNIVFDDAVIPNAVNGCIAGIFAAGGQTCLAGSRLFLHESVYDEFLERLIERTRTIRLGDPSEWNRRWGPGDHGPVAQGGTLCRRRHQRRRQTCLGEGAPKTPRSVKAGSSCPPSSTVWRTICAWPRKRFSGRCSRSLSSGRKRRPSPLQTGHDTAWRRASGPMTSSGPIGWQGDWRRAPCGSTPIAPFPMRLPSEATSRAATAERWDRRP